MDLGSRANEIMDRRAAIADEPKHAVERYDRLMKYGL